MRCLRNFEKKSTFMSSYQNKETLVVNQNLISAKQPFETISLNTTTFVRNLKHKGRLQRNQITERSRKKRNWTQNLSFHRLLCVYRVPSHILWFRPNSYVRTVAAFLKAHGNGAPLVHAFILWIVAQCVAQTRCRQASKARSVDWSWKRRGGKRTQVEI